MKFAVCLLLGAQSQSVWALDNADPQRLSGIRPIGFGDSDKAGQ